MQGRIKSMGTFQELNKKDEINFVKEIGEVDEKNGPEDLIKSYSDLLDSSLRSKTNVSMASKHHDRKIEVIAV